VDTSLPVCFKEDTRNLKDAFGEVRPREIRYVGVAIDGASYRWRICPGAREGAARGHRRARDDRLDRAMTADSFRAQTELSNNK